MMQNTERAYNFMSTITDNIEYMSLYHRYNENKYLS